jgi:hypothetical protein
VLQDFQGVGLEKELLPFDLAQELLHAAADLGRRRARVSVPLPPAAIQKNLSRLISRAYL